MGMPDPDVLMRILLIQYPCLLFSLCFHEAAHAWMSNRCGDPSARLLGRLTLNPVKHADPIGTVAMPLIMMVFGVPFLFGWAKPVPFNPVNLNNIRRDPVLIALAGPASNVLLTLITVVLIRGLLFLGDAGALPGDMLIQALLFLLAFAMINLVLALFNMIPVPPLDGHYLLNYFLPPSGQRVMQQIGPMGILIAILVANTVLPVVLWPLYDLVVSASGVPV
jgi:Zn-dependent protease